MLPLDAGYVIVMRTSVFLRKYELDLHASLSKKEVSDHLAELARLRAALSFVDPAEYRGIDRRPLAADTPIDRSELKRWVDEEQDPDFRSLAKSLLDEPEHPPDPVDRAAREALADLLGPGQPDVLYDPWLIQRLDDARAVWRLLDEPFDWEIVRLAYAPLYRPDRAPPFDRPDRALGYDLGWYGDEGYSILRDCAVAPKWHPPSPEDYAELAHQLRGLNERVLFNTPDHALGFKRWYVSRSWAETEDEWDPFRVVAVELP